MFRLAQRITYTWPVTVRRPIDGGRFESDSFRAIFSPLSKTEVDEEQKAWRAAFDAGKTADDFATWLLRRVWVGVPDNEIGDDDGQPLPWSASLRDRLLADIFIGPAVWQAYIASVAPEAAAERRLGN